jgi:hypothetical protein
MDPSVPHVPHSTSLFARAPSSLLFCGVRNTHKPSRFLPISQRNWPVSLPFLNHSALALFAQRMRILTSAAALASVSLGSVLVRVRVSATALSRVQPFLGSKVIKIRIPSYISEEERQKRIIAL